MESTEPNASKNKKTSISREITNCLKSFHLLGNGTNNVYKAIRQFQYKELQLYYDTIEYILQNILF